MAGSGTILRGRIIHAPVFGSLREWRDGAVVWDANGLITDAGSARDLLARNLDARIIDVRPWVVIPGLVDTHTHLPQYPAAGIGSGELLPWLERFIFPLEHDFRVEQAERLAPLFFRELALNGITSCAVYSALWEDSCHVCFRHAEASGLRVTMGKMMMDYATYSETAPVRIVEQSLEETDRLCRQWHGRDNGRLRYAVSPRFAVACTEQLMRGAAEIAERHGASIQTHLAENGEEGDVVAHRFPDALDYTDVYDRCGLLGPRTILGHAIHLSDREIDRIAESGSSVAHCPTSNFFLRSGLMDLWRLRDAGITVGLGSDVAAGPELNPWRVQRAAIETRNALAATKPTTPALEPRHAFHLATVGGAQALGRGDETGDFEVGKQADAVVLNISAVAPPGTDVEALNADEVLALCVWRGDARMTKRVFVGGREVGIKDY